MVFLLLVVIIVYIITINFNHKYKYKAFYLILEMNTSALGYYEAKDKTYVNLNSKIIDRFFEESFVKEGEEILIGNEYGVRVYILDIQSKKEIVINQNKNVFVKDHNLFRKIDVENSLLEELIKELHKKSKMDKLLREYTKIK